MTSPPAPHFLSLARPDALAGPPMGVPDTTTVAAHDFDVDARTGFMPPQPPLARLPQTWEQWEAALENAVDKQLKLAEARNSTSADRDASERWRLAVRNLPVLKTNALAESEVQLRRAHLVLAWLMHFYINTLPATDSIVIPRSLSIPLLEVSQLLDLPPVLTYSDDVLYNWKFREDLSSTPALPTAEAITTQTTFTSTRSEEHFYLVSAYIELRGSAALSLMSRIMDEAFVRDAIALRRIGLYLQRLSCVVDELTELLKTMRDHCDPEVFYHEIRPWFKGQDSMEGGRKWRFDGVGEAGYEHLRPPPDHDLHGPSAGQSSIIHALDIFLGVENHSNVPAAAPDAAASGDGSGPKAPHQSFLSRMQAYMPRHHRSFLRHLAANPRPVREIVEMETKDGHNTQLLEGFNAAVMSLKVLRDYHIRIVATYIVGPARRVEAGARKASESTKPDSFALSSNPDAFDDDVNLKGTGGTNAMAFLKSVRDRTLQTVLHDAVRPK